MSRPCWKARTGVLNLSDLGLGNEGIAAVIQTLAVQNMAHLRELDLSFNNVNEIDALAGIVRLAANAPNLASIGLEESEIGSWSAAFHELFSKGNRSNQ